MHRRRAELEAEGCVIAGSPKPLPEQAVYEMVPSEAEAVGARRPFQGTRKTGLDRFYYREVFCGDNMVDWFVFEKEKLTAGKVLRRKPMSGRATWINMEHPAETIRLQKDVKC